MRVLVAGATGAVGRPLVRRLLEAGHEVTGITRSPDRAAALRGAGAAAIICDALDAAALTAAVGRAAPDAVIDQLTSLDADIMRVAATLDVHLRTRRDGSGALLRAATGAGVRRYVAQSVAFLTAPEGGAVLDEDARPYDDGPAPLPEMTRVFGGLERDVTAAGGTVLRYGVFHGPGTWYDPEGGSIASMVRRRRYPLIGGGAGVTSFVHVEDAAAACVLALEAGHAGVLNVCDDEPAPVREWLPAYARALGAPPPRRIPAWLARRLAGPYAVHLATRARGASNARARERLGFRPAVPSWRGSLGAA